MIVKLEENSSVTEIEVLIQYARMSESVKKLEALVRSAGKTIKGISGEHITLVNASDIYYIESIDKQTFLYCEKLIYQSDLRLYQILAELEDAGFVQVSKACILNLNRLESIRPLLNSRLEASLSNGEKIHVTRKYLSTIRTKLQEGQVCHEKENS